jgi:hypothetical protein
VYTLVARQGLGKNVTASTNTGVTVFFAIPFYLQSAPVRSANCVSTYTVPLFYICNNRRIVG